MPHLNRSQSLPNRGISSSRGKDTCFPFTSHSMPVSDSSSPYYNASIRRLGPRRARPSAASIADLFVSSLVLASFCRDHSPHGRGLSTVAVTAANHNVARIQRRGMASMGRLASGKRPGSVASPAEYSVVNRTGPRREFNSGVVQKVKDDDQGENHMADASTDDMVMERPSKDPRVGRSRGQKRNPSPFRFGKPGRKSFHDGDAGLLIGSKYATCDEMLLNQAWDPPDTVESPHHAEPRSEETSDVLAPLPEPTMIDISSDLQEEPSTDVGNYKTQSPLPKHDKDTGRDATEYQAVQRIIEALRDSTKNNQYIFRCYRELPSPGVAHLSKRSRGSLLKKLSQPPNRRWVDARRYLAVVEDMIAAKLPLSPALWTSAIHLAGRATGTVKKWDLIRAIGLWQQMEHLAGIKSDHVVFTTLFDISIKAGQFTVADRLLQEMARRGIEFGRAGKVSKIYYYGLLRDANGIHRAFDDFLASGEIVDTAVLNCLMISFIRAGEIKTAEQLYQRMMKSQEATRQAKDPANDVDQTHGPVLASEFVMYRKTSRELNRVFQMAARLKSSLPAHHRALQDSIAMSPDTRTFHIFLSYHAYHSGNLQAFKKILEDMEKTFAMPPRGMIYLLLFEGFARHGRRRKGWTADRLRLAWRAYLRVLYESRTRLNGDYSFQLPQLTWENPLGGMSVSMLEKSAGRLGQTPTQQTSLGLYTSLPSSTTEANVVSEQNEPTEENRSNFANVEDILEFDDNVDLDVDDLFLNPTGHEQSATDDMEQELRRRIENGVFLGRRMIIIIIRAFGVCCGPEEVMEVWLSMERVWRPQKRKSSDVQAVREELERYIKDFQ